MIRRLRTMRSRDDSGFTLIELMVATLLTSVILFAALQVLDNVTKNERGQAVRHTAMLEIRQAMTRVTRDLRQATWIDPTSNHFRLTMKTLSEGAEVDVTYELILTDPDQDIYELRRSLAGGPYALVTNVVLDTTTDPAICYSYYSAGSPSECLDPAPPDDHPPDELTAIRITFAKDPEHNPAGPITLATDVQLRNI